MLLCQKGCKGRVRWMVVGCVCVCVYVDVCVFVGENECEI